jgi:hypothetical protein
LAAHNGLIVSLRDRDYKKPVEMKQPEEKPESKPTRKPKAKPPAPREEPPPEKTDGDDKEKKDKN